MKNLKEVAAESKHGCPLYYSVKENAVYTTGGSGRYYLTDLIRENTPKEIVAAVHKYMSM